MNKMTKNDCFLAEIAKGETGVVKIGRTTGKKNVKGGGEGGVKARM